MGLAVTSIAEYKRKIKQRCRLTPKKKRLAELIAAGVPRDEACYQAGYKNNRVAYKYLAKTPGGDWCDPGFGRYVESLQSAPAEIVQTKDPEVLIAYQEITRQTIVEEIYRLFTDPGTPPGAKAKVGEILLKEIRWQEERTAFTELPPEEAERRARMLLGLK
jgi:hypothetical protein